MLLEIQKLDADRGFRLVGELDASNVGDLREALEPVVAEGGDITLDLAGLAFMDSSGIQILVTTAQGLDDRGTLILLSPGNLVRRLLSLIPVERLDNVRIEAEEEP
jgi:anti-sigma B factor antagonist